MYKRVLVPVDLTEKSRKAVDVAFDFATRLGSQVVLLHVIETIEHVQFEFEQLKPFYDRIENSACRGLQKLSERFVSNHLSVDQSVVYGHRAEQIIDFAIRNNIDLIVMASHRIDPDRPGHDSSSISYTVAILSPVTVMLVK